MYIYICMYIYMCVCVCVHICMYVYMCIYIYIYIYIIWGIQFLYIIWLSLYMRCMCVHILNFPKELRTTPFPELKKQAHKIWISTSYLLPWKLGNISHAGSSKIPLSSYFLLFSNFSCVFLIVSALRHLILTVQIFVYEPLIHLQKCHRLQHPSAEW
jgi:hypothetical protein